MGFKQFVKSKTFWVHLGLIVASFFALMVTVFFILKAYTRHRDEYIVPEIGGKHLREAQQLDEMSHFEIVVIDSIFQEETPAGMILSQEPTAGAKVKKGRKIYVTVTSESGDDVAMPLCTDLSLKTAVQSLTDIGLKIGTISFVPGHISNIVANQKIGGRSVRPNEKVRRGDMVDLVVEMNIDNSTTNMPDILGKTEQEAEKMLWSAGLNVGKKTFEGHKDNRHSRVVSYTPTFRGLTLGTTVSLTFVNDTKSSYKKKIRSFEEQLILDQNEYEKVSEE